jgi:thiol-disulfide isomerase/thioredoxin
MRSPATCGPLFWVGAWLLLAACGTALPRSSPHGILGKAPEPASRALLDGTVVAIPPPDKVTVIDFWSLSCEPCLAAMPGLERLWRSSDKSTVAFVGVSIDDDSYAVERRAAELGVTFPQTIDDGLVLKGRYRVDELPATFVLDRQGRIRYFTDDALANMKRIADAIAALAAE